MVTPRPYLCRRCGSLNYDRNNSAGGPHTKAVCDEKRAEILALEAADDERRSTAGLPPLTWETPL